MAHHNSTLASSLAALRKNEEGTTSIEYGLLASLVAMAMMQAVDTVGTALTGTLDAASAGLASGAAPEPAVAAADEPAPAAAKSAPEPSAPSAAPMG